MSAFSRVASSYPSSLFKSTVEDPDIGSNSPFGQAVGILVLLYLTSVFRPGPALNDV